MSPTQTFVIIGAGLAGATAAEQLRVRGFHGRIVLIGDEPELPYERPPLSKGLLTGDVTRDSVFVHQPNYYRDHAIEVLQATQVAELDPAANHVVLADGTRLHFDKALLATGAEPRRLDIPGSRLPGVHYLRTLADADALAAAAGTASSVAVIGAGWLGSETAAALRSRGLPVTLIGRSTVPMEYVLGRQVGAVYRDLHARNGVTLRLDESVQALHGGTHVERVTTTTGAPVDADLVIVAIGAHPRVRLGTQAGLAVDNGILTDEHLRTSNPNIYAIGDVARAWHPALRTRQRVEHWANARDQAATAAANLLGADTPHTPVPYVFSDQYDLGMEYVGHSLPSDDVVFRGDPSAGAFIAFWLRDGVITAALNANLWGVNDQLQRLVRERARVAPESLADPDLPLTALHVTSEEMRH